MDTRHVLEDEINQLTTEMREDFPELYKLLLETPLPSNAGSALTDADLENYLLTLRAQLKRAKSERPKDEYECMIG